MYFLIIIIIILSFFFLFFRLKFSCSTLQQSAFSVNGYEILESYGEASISVEDVSVENVVKTSSPQPNSQRSDIVSAAIIVDSDEDESGITELRKDGKL